MTMMDNKVEPIEQTEMGSVMANDVLVTDEVHPTDVDEKDAPFDFNSQPKTLQ
jgi:hypothetical protein